MGSCQVRSAERKTEIAVGRLVDRPDAVELRVNGTRWRPEVSVYVGRLLRDPMCSLKDPKRNFLLGNYS